jgi:hypothetical protein
MYDTLFSGLPGNAVADDARWTVELAHLKCQLSKKETAITPCEEFYFLDYLHT